MYDKILGLIPMVRRAFTLVGCYGWYEDIRGTITTMYVLNELTEKEASDLTAKLMEARADRTMELKAKEALKKGGLA